MNGRIIKAIAEKDLREVRKNRIAVIAAIMLSIIFSILLPLLITQIPALSGSSGSSGNIPIPPELSGQLAGLSQDQAIIVVFLGYLFAPLFLVLPLMLSSIIAAESFVGEKERKTLEALIYTPATDLELFLGKVVAGMVPSLLFAWGNFVVYSVVANIASWPVMGKVWFPTPPWWGIMLLLVPGIALLGISVTVLISSRVNTFMEAYQASGTLALIVVALFIGQISGIIFLGTGLLVLVGALLFAADGALIWFGTKVFNRSELIARI